MRWAFFVRHAQHRFDRARRQTRLTAVPLRDSADPGHTLSVNRERQRRIASNPPHTIVRSPRWSFQHMPTIGA